MDWFKLDLYNVELHILTSTMRQRYALESLYGFDDDICFLDENTNDYGLNKDFLPPPLCVLNTEFTTLSEKTN